MSFSLGEIIVLLAVGSWAFGPKELPRIGKTLGKLTGRATGFIYKARANLSQFAEQTEMTKVQQELQATMHQLEVIRSELRGGINILNPGPLTRRAIGAINTQDTKSSNATDNTTNNGDPTTLQQHNFTSNQQQRQTQHQTQQTSFAASAFPSNLNPSPTFTHNNPSINNVYGANDTIIHDNNGHFSSTSSSEIDVIPVSAVAAGLVPDRSKSMPTGSEVLFDAMQEERVAQQALAFFHNNNHGMNINDPVGGSTDGGKGGKNKDS